MKKIVSIFLLLCLTAVLSAAPIDEQRARRIATDLFSQSVSRSTTPVELVWAGSDFSTAPCTTAGEALLYIYNRSDRNGFVVIAGEEGAGPVIAYSHERAFDVERMAPGARAMLEGWMKQIAAVRAGAVPQAAITPTLPGSLACKYETALWGQDQPYNNETPVYDGRRSMTGCVATAISIICHANRYPERGVGTTEAYSYNDNYGVYREVAAYELGRTYEYDKMLSDYSKGYSDEQAAAVAALMHDIGRLVQMRYHYTQSSAGGAIAVDAMALHFGYSRAAEHVSANNYTDSEWITLLKENLRTCGPTYIEGSSSNGGHAYVFDGYTTNNYFSVNYGWSGQSNGFYLLPDIAYSNAQYMLRGLKPDPSGTSAFPDKIEILRRGLRSKAAEHHPGVAFKMDLQGIVNVGRGEFNGSFILALCRADGSVKETLKIYPNIVIAPSAEIEFIDQSITFSKSLEEGDRLRLFCKSRQSSSMQWIRSSTTGHSGIDYYADLLLVATPEEAISGVNLYYDKSKGLLNFWGHYAISCEITNISTGEVILSGKVPAYERIGLENFAIPPGKYRLSIASGGRPYELTLKF